MKTRGVIELERWLTDCERLGNDEAVALRGHDFPSILRIQSLKPLFLEKIVSLAAELGIDRSDEWFDERIGALMALEHENIALATGALRQAKAERERFDLVRHRLRDFSQAYASVGRKGRQLLGHS